jgi:hypothetical protein
MRGPVSFMTGGVSHPAGVEGSTGGAYDALMAGNFRIWRRHTRTFFTNWTASDAPISTKLQLTVRNRVKALRTGCCGNPGEPGC